VDPSQASRKRKPGQDASHFKTDKSGKLIIDEPAAGTSGPGGPSEIERMAGDAYLSGQMQVGGAVRDAKGNLKFNKNTKRAREVEKEYEDTYSGGVLEKEEVIKKKPKSVTKLGEEFRSKVCVPLLSFDSCLGHPFLVTIGTISEEQPMRISTSFPDLANCPIPRSHPLPHRGMRTTLTHSAEKETSRNKAGQTHIHTYRSIKLPEGKRVNRVG
jgi:hypothetical protein